ncbi:hypothetical protein HPT27_05335 [Permianibacter sp. IMCC34836]|uniref:DUF6249 domain-containing protein n=1 Tax=Permianibacter fluminis TaxID=2738515 RepID=UPI0015535DCA|nr:DUF6249 domain-containing protein [Permianibacter fluminis]NQD36441.1 hypothetical protein [Permianibacter fluminis]
MNEALIPIIIVPVVFITLAFVANIAINHFSRLRLQEREMLNKERMGAMERGINVPLLEAPRPHRNRPALNTGLTLLAVGIGIGVYMFDGWHDNDWALGLIVALAGAAKLVYWQLAGKAEWQNHLQQDKVVSEAYLTYLHELTNKIRNG